MNRLIIYLLEGSKLYLPLFHLFCEHQYHHLFWVPWPAMLLLTMIDPSTGWFEVKDVKDKSAKESMYTFADVWLSRYPRPEYIGFDNGGEYKNVFEELVNNYGINKKNSMPFNPQYNGKVERFHLTLNDSLRTAEADGREMDEKDPWGPFLASAAYAIHSTFHTTLKARHGTAHKIYGRLESN
jgi:hypothetical protein